MCASHMAVKEEKKTDWNSPWQLDVKSWNAFLNQNGQTSPCSCGYSYSAQLLCLYIVADVIIFRMGCVLSPLESLCPFFFFFFRFCLLYQPRDPANASSLLFRFFFFSFFNPTCRFFHYPFISATFPKPVLFYMCIHAGLRLTQTRTPATASVFNHWL